VRLSIGLPVFNGERFLPEALRAFQAQTFGDYELILCDNASTDRTGEICRDFAAGDARIRYFRNDHNLGAAPNYRRTFELAAGEYFKWAACDDVCEPAYLERCIEALDRDPGAVLCHARTVEIDAFGKAVRTYDYRMRFGSPYAHERFRDLITVRHPSVAVFGVIRRDVLAKTALIGSYVSSDRVLLAELALHGRFLEAPEPLFLRRVHAGNSIWLGKHTDLVTWYDARLTGTGSYPAWRLARELTMVAARAPLGPRERMLCLAQIPRHVASRRHALIEDLVYAARRGLARIEPLRRLARALRETPSADIAAHADPTRSARESRPTVR
jgi:glycosyltransferase involved in cell wall biosynthesis